MSSSGSGSGQLQLGTAQPIHDLPEKQGPPRVETTMPVGDHARIQSLITPLTAGHPRVRAPVEALLGTPLKPTELTRGVCARPAIPLPAPSFG